MRLRKFRRGNNDPTPGDDSFLDIVANLVGILIILVVVVGANAGSKIHQQAISEVDQVELTDLEKGYQKTRKHAAALQTDNLQMENRIRAEQAFADQRKVERDRLLIQVRQAESDLQNEKLQLTETHQKVLSTSETLASLRSEFRELDSQYTSLDSVASKEETIEHFPTPIAKTVFSDEIHFRLRGGRLVHVPMTDLVDLMKDEWKAKAKKLESADETMETVGPIEQFRLQYHLRAEPRQVQTAYGTNEERFIEFTRFVLVPTSENIGVPIDQAMQEGSDFNTWLGLSTPERTTVSVWVYPDSFEEFNQLKKSLYKRGFKTACWPLSANSPISGGPSGYRSTAQ